MHVIIDATTTQDEKAYHGIGQYTKNICKHLAVNFPEDKFTFLLFNAKSTLDEFLDADSKNVSVLRIGHLRKNNYLNFLWYLTQLKPGIKKAQGLFENEQTAYFCPYFWRYFPVRNIPVVLMVHDMILPVLNAYSNRQGFMSDIRKFQYWHALNRSKKCRKIITNSDYTRKDFLKFFPELDEKKVERVYLGIEKLNCRNDEKSVKSEKSIIDKYLPKDWRERGYLIYMGGGITKNKNTFGVVRSYKKFLARWFNDENCGNTDGQSSEVGSKTSTCKPPYLVVAGKIFEDLNNPNVLKLHKMIKEVGVHKNVIFIGFYEDEDKCPLLKKSFALIHLSTYEGFGITVGEALSCGVPVIAHDGTSYPEVIGNAGILVDGKNYSKVGRKIYDLWSNPEMRKELGRKGIEQAAKFDWNNTAKRTGEILKSCVR